MISPMPITFTTMFVATCAIAGVPFLSGWYSKEMILEKVYEHNPLMFYLLASAALLTAFYMFRAVFLTFYGTERFDAKHHTPHEVDWKMWLPFRSRKDRPRSRARMG